MLITKIRYFGLASATLGTIRIMETEGTFDEHINDFSRVITFCFTRTDDNLVVFSTQTECTLYVPSFVKAIKEEEKRCIGKLTFPQVRCQ